MLRTTKKLLIYLKFPKTGKYRCYVYNCSDFKTQLLGEIEILND